MEKRKPGRPAGSKDSKPRTYRSRAAIYNFGYGTEGMPSVEERIKQLVYPVRVSTLAAISGLSSATIRKKIEQGKLHAFQRSGVILVEPRDFLAYWLKGKE